MNKYSYITDPAKIEQESFARIKQLSSFDGMQEQQRQVAMRLIHTCGDPDIITDLKFSRHACEAGIAALQDQCDIISDVEMVRSGISPLCGSSGKCYIKHDSCKRKAETENITRAMAAMDLAQSQLHGNIIVIGNAPTALFRLLEILSDRSIRPALIIAMPVGFVGAEESKQACWRLCQSEALPCITLMGRKGGSALAVASINALCRMARGIML